MRKAMRKSLFVVLLLVVLGCISWQMSTLFYSNAVARSSERGPRTNLSRKANLKKPTNSKPCTDGTCHLRHKHGHHGLTFDANQFYLDGKPLRILSGSFHYFRTQPHQWIDRLDRLKAAGLNTVSSYVPWNLHEKFRGKYNFFGRWKLFTFIKLVQKMGLHMILRPGPYICAEWELGGLPSWLLRDPNMTVRTSKYQPYLEHVELYFNQLLPHLSEFCHRNGGPIIAFQIENEFGNYGHDDDDYLRFLVGLYEKHGIKELLLTSDPFSPEGLERGTLPHLLAAINFNKYPLQALQHLKKFRPNQPLMVMEFWPGWFDSWGQPHHTMAAVEFIETVDVILSMNASINFYMFVGGTNFGFWNGAGYDGTPNRYLPTTTSYDYDALVSESGDCHPTKYKALRLLLLKHRLVSHSLPPIPKNPQKAAYGSVAISDVLRMDDFLALVLHKPTTLARPVFMEYLNIYNHGGAGQSFGWILYRTTFDFGTVLLLQGIVQNRAQIFVNGDPVKVIFNGPMGNLSESVLIELKSLRNGNNRLEILVENMGRMNGWKLDEQRRGFQGTVTVNGKVLSAWEHVSLDFTDDFISAVSKCKKWKPYVAENYPSLYRGYLHIQNLRDTFLSMRRWSKGIVIINGYNVGRFWNVGPQQTLYIPKPLLRKGKNEIIVFELEKPGKQLEFVANAILDTVTTSVV